mmetsp:Transcript_8936/g.12125  ORF Transcript_8936/g.12125 Transcript_8936/m.12125 type:complete len:128 (-) Transcript_8936:83-466(-)
MFFWQSIKPNGGGVPTGKLLELIKRDFGSYDVFYNKFIEIASPVDAFGSGYVWLILNQEIKLEIIFTKNAENPVASELGCPLLVLDVWVTFLDYQVDRPSYVKAFLDHLVNFEKCLQRLERAPQIVF